MSFNLNEAKALFKAGLSDLSEMLDREQLRDLGPDVAEEILMNLAVVTLQAYEKQTGSLPADEKELAQLVMASIKSLYRMRSGILMASRKVMRNPNTASQKLKRSL